MADKDQHQAFVDNHFKNIHMARPNKPITRWTDPELETGFIRNMGKDFDGEKYNNPQGVRAANDSLAIIGGEAERRTDIRNAENAANAQRIKDATNPVRKFMRSIGLGNKNK